MKSITQQVSADLCHSATARTTDARCQAIALLCPEGFWKNPCKLKIRGST
ncbi:hypothetical protein HW132_20745 [Brasilonema sp. CT11]|nr:hypothetical protein [Brasilonema sp. CT11]